MGRARCSRRRARRIGADSVPAPTPLAPPAPARPPARPQVKALACEPGLASTELQSTSHKNGGVTTFEAQLFYYLNQSAQDGALPALQSCFAPSAQSGDFYVPKNYFYGSPIAAANAGVFVNPRMERASADVASRDVLWTAAEQAVGAFAVNA